MNPENAITLYGRGNVYLDLKKYDKALIDYNHSLSIKPEDFNTVHNRALVYIRLGRIEEAIVELNCCIKWMPGHPNPYYNLACIYSVIGESERAMDYLETAIDLRTEYKGVAMKEEDFNNIMHELRFKQLLE